MKLDFSKCTTREDVERVAKPLGDLIASEDPAVLRREPIQALDYPSGRRLPEPRRKPRTPEGARRKGGR